MIGALRILGCNSALPTLERNATSQYLETSKIKSKEQWAKDLLNG